MDRPADDPFNSFRPPPGFYPLKEAAIDEPVVIININVHHSDAIILLRSRDPVRVPLRAVGPALAIDLTHDLAMHTDIPNLITSLRIIWSKIVAPVVKELRNLQVIQWSRIWWYPVGAATMLPLHAAGPYEEYEENLSDLFVSSYTPTLGALIHARQPEPAEEEPKKPDGRSLIVVQSWLAEVWGEGGPIGRYIPDAFILPTGDPGINSILQEVQRSQRLHLVCSCHRDKLQPFYPQFEFRLGHTYTIPLLDLVPKDANKLELAVLLLDCSPKDSELFLSLHSLHPAAEVMFAGVKSVVGSLSSRWSDHEMPLMERFYKCIGSKDFKNEAAALGAAFCHEELRGNMTDYTTTVLFRQFINTFHYGI